MLSSSGISKDYINSWKNEEVCKKQLELNLKELTNGYPPHWKTFLEYLQLLKDKSIKTILDVGCGCGIYSELCKKHFPDIIYSGMDYSAEAIQLAKRTWTNGYFSVRNYKDLTVEVVNRYDVLHSSSLLNVLPNGDEALEFLLQLQPEHIIFGKLLTTNDESNYKVYSAYDIITTYEFRHNITKVYNLFKKYNYNIQTSNDQLPMNFLLIRNY